MRTAMFRYKSVTCYVQNIKFTRFTRVCFGRGERKRIYDFLSSFHDARVWDKRKKDLSILLYQWKTLKVVLCFYYMYMYVGVANISSASAVPS